MLLLFYILELTCHIMKTSFIFHYLLNLNIKSKRFFFILTTVTEVGLILIYCLQLPSFIRSLYIVIFAPVFIYLFSVNNLSKTIISYSILCSFLIGGIDTLMADIIFTIGKLFNVNLHKTFVGTLVSIFTLIYWFLTSYYINKKYMNYSARRQTHFFVFISLASFFNSGIYMLFLECVYSAKFANYANTSIIQCALIFFGIILIAEITYILYLYYEKTHYSLINDFTQEYLDIKKSHFQEMQLRDKNTRMFRHDIQAHLAVINDFAKEGNCDKLLHYLHSINDAFTTIKPKFSTGNEIIDSVLNQKTSLIEDNQIKLRIRGNELSDLNDIDEFDLCTIFTNAIQNAIEACIQIPEIQKRQIQILLRSDDNLFIIEFSNTVKAKLKIKNNRITTGKTDKQNHGFGLVQIEQVIQNHQGHMHMNCDNHMFKLVLHIPKEATQHD